MAVFNSYVKLPEGIYMVKQLVGILHMVAYQIPVLPKHPPIVDKDFSGILLAPHQKHCQLHNRAPKKRQHYCSRIFLDDICLCVPHKFQLTTDFYLFEGVASKLPSSIYYTQYTQLDTKCIFQRIYIYSIYIIGSFRKLGTQHHPKLVILN